jgi:hypothetical protein
MGRSQFQHYLPEVYLKGFATANGEVWRYDRTNTHLKRLPPRVIGAENDLYSVAYGETLLHALETQWFNPLDGCFGPILGKLQKNEALLPSELEQLASFVSYLRVRTPTRIREVGLLIRQLEHEIGAPREMIEYHTEPPNHGRDCYTTTSERSDYVPQSRGDPDARNEVLITLVKTGQRIAESILNLSWTILRAPAGKSFVTGDDPFVIVPPVSHRADLEGVGPVTPGAAVFIPLSAALCLRITNTGNARSYAQPDGAAVRAINACQVFHSERFLFSCSDDLLKSLAARFIRQPGANRGEVIIRQAASLSEPESRSLFHTFAKCRIPSEWAAKVPME